MIIAVMFLGVTAAFSQVDQVYVSWNSTECNCFDQGNSYYSVKVVIYDVANDMVVVEGTEAKVDFGTYNVYVDVPEANEHCANPNLPYTPNLKVMAGVAVMCDSYNPPEAVCNGYNELPNQACSDFDPYVQITVVIN
ncbi:MAG TPA: hypothetical protein VIN10_11160 [Bacteroidales bacterium]